MNRKHISKHTGLTGVQAGHIIKSLKSQGLDIQTVDWKAMGESTRDYGDRYGAVKKYLGTMHGIRMGIPTSSIRHKEQEYTAMEEYNIMDELMGIHEARSKRSKHADYARKAKGTFKPTNKKGVKKWKKHPNRYDIIGIDDLI